MTASRELDELFESLASDQRRATEGVCQGRTSLPVLQMISAALGRLDEVSGASPQAAQRACQAGCSACCYLQVAVTAPEALWIADQLRATLTAADFEAAQTRIAANSRQVSHLTLEGRARARVPCALLDENGACGIYPFRPLGCRGFTSLDREICEQALERDEPGHSGPMDRVAWGAAAALAEGLCAGMAASSVDNGHYEFHSAVGRALETPNAAERWLQGEDVFSDCGRVVSERMRR